MTIEALLVGRLHEPARERTAAASGRRFVTCKVRVPAGDGPDLFINAACFDPTACAALLALGAGDSVALGGTLKPGAWTDREGNPRPSVDLVANVVMTVYDLKRRRAAVQSAAQPEPSAPPAASRQPALETDFEDDPAWLQGGAA